MQFENPISAASPVWRWRLKRCARAAPRRLLLNAANEVAVQAFLDQRIGFRDIDRVIARSCTKTNMAPPAVSRR
ncbi:hypothetical protein LP419_37275 [Massilia sp. H-1]|nr:hypothetical protein LP419_37275 [Massilia sp. H-1]